MKRSVVGDQLTWSKWGHSALVLMVAAKVKVREQIWDQASADECDYFHINPSASASGMLQSRVLLNQPRRAPDMP